ncbi:16S rRNA (cytidine(1402)-2'-O)-methyltransferase [Algirhabdus cladophorae]|uniref:16S rRNA (cytidine(1402)-2'-O)-methyltransferase n=1 Tax=Algirhabdus cladophorae TaxID=3377108 RepID=UPI003B84A036
MNYEIKPLSAGLYFVATPIGTARDITLRALDILASADVIAAEDTRTTKRLMDIHGVPLNGRQMIAYHDHNGTKARPGLMKLLAAGKSVAYASEAGSPLVADPGYALAKLAAEEGHMVTCAPGPSAPLAALTLSGLPSDRFLFAGFAPNAKAARRKWLGGLGDVQATLLIFESPKRIHALLADMSDTLGERQIAVCRELTKRFEEVLRGSVSEVLLAIENKRPKGEIVVVVDRASAVVADHASIEESLRIAMETLSRKDAIAQVATELDVPRRTVYQLALDLDK